MAVVLYHLWPNRVSGGFVGVDVFFVISGFLITGHLLREAESSGTVRLLRFWARRIARLLPASLLVLAVVAVATYFLVPKDLWPDYFAQIRASAMYYENWQLAWDSVDYMAIGSQATAVQHYWSLSVEEQFYLIWPILIVLGLSLARRARGETSPRTVLIWILSMVALVSFWFSVTATSQNPSWAYFATFTRVWEFAIGGMVALTATYVSGRVWRSAYASIAGWLGLVLILLAALMFDGETQFPGYTAAMPVIGTALILYFGDSEASGSPRRFLSWRPMVWAGGISYAIYLWHWPPIVILPLVTGSVLNWRQKLVIGVGVVIVSHFSTHYFEAPLRASRFFSRPRNALSFALAGALVFFGVNAAVQAQLQHEDRAAAARLEERLRESCTGPGALDPDNNCGDPLGTGSYVVDPEVVALQNKGAKFGACQGGFNGSEVKSCVLGTDDEAPKKKLIIAGDSHATQWLPGLDEISEKNQWEIATYAKASCPLSLSRRVLEGEETEDNARDCDVWVDQVLATIEHSDADIVFLTSYQSAYEWESRPEDPQYADPVDGYAAAMEAIADSGKKVVVIKAVPRTNGEYVTRCLVGNGRNLETCGATRTDALPPDLMVAAADKLDRSDVKVLDLDSQFCDDEWCYPVVGDVVVYRDYSHISAEYSRALMPWVVPLISNER